MSSRVLVAGLIRGVSMHRKRIVAAVAVPVVVIAAWLALNVTGVAPIPTGPLGDHEPPVRDIAWSTLNYVPVRTIHYLTPLVENTWSLPVTVVRLTPTGVSAHGSVDVVGSLPFDYDDPSERNPDGTDKVALGIQASPGSTWDHPDPVTGVTVPPRGEALHAGRAFLVRITTDPVWDTYVTRFDVEYTVGPFHFLTTAQGPLGTTVIVCGQKNDAVAASYGCPSTP